MFILESHLDLLLTALRSDLSSHQITRAGQRPLCGSPLLNAEPNAASYHDAMLEQWDGPTDQLIGCLRHAPSLARDNALYHAADGYVGVDRFTANQACNRNLPATVFLLKLATGCATNRFC